jgi:hypothetical protein
VNRNIVRLLLVTALLAGGLLLAGLFTPGVRAADESTPPPPIEETPGVAPPPASTSESETITPSEPLPSGRFVAEVIDSTYFVEPAQFFALDLPVRAQGGALAAHIMGDVSVVGGRHDIIARLFRASDYQDWLKRRGGRQANPIWSSKRARSVHIDMELPQGTTMVLLLDNGYSLRTPKRVRVQVQLQYQGEGGRAVSAQPAAHVPEEGDVTPRANTDDSAPPPPPPPSN